MIGFIVRYWKGIMWAAVAAAAVGLGVAVVSAVRDYADTKSRLGAMETAVEVQKSTIQAQREALDEWAAWREEQERKLEELSNVSRDARREVAETRRELSEMDFDAMDDETLRAVVNGLDDRARCLLATGTGADLDCPGED